MTWQEQAACRGMDTSLFFPDTPATGMYDDARAVCARCPVRPECLADALDRDEKHGVWGGLSEHQRDRIRNPRTKWGQRYRPVPEGVPHGKQAYNTYGCKCQVCLAGRAAYLRERRARKKVSA